MPSLMIVSNSAITCSFFVWLIFVPTLARFGQTLIAALLHSLQAPALLSLPPALTIAPAPRNCSLHQKLRRSSILAAVAKQMARCRISAPSILDGDPAVNGDRTVPIGTLHAPPFTTREVAHDLHRLDCELVEIVDHDVGPTAFDQRAAILEAAH